MADRDLPAGGFSSWLRATRVTLVTEHEAEVSCGECYACCTTSHFVHVRSDEARTLAAIPRELLFPAPGLPAGNFVLGYDEQGRCPMLIDGGCSIYKDRPRTCRTYDCRVFAAAGIAADRDPITRQARRWRFGDSLPGRSRRPRGGEDRPRRSCGSERSAFPAAQGTASRCRWLSSPSRSTTSSGSPAMVRRGRARVVGR